MQNADPSILDENTMYCMVKCESTDGNLYCGCYSAWLQIIEIEELLDLLGRSYMIDCILTGKSLELVHIMKREG